MRVVEDNMFNSENNTMLSVSSPFPGFTEKQNRKKNRFPQFRGNSPRQFQTQSQSQEQQDWNNTRRSMSAGAVLCSNAQHLFPNIVGSGDQNQVGTGKLGYFGNDNFLNPQTGHIVQSLEQPNFYLKQFTRSAPSLPMLPTPRHSGTQTSQTSTFFNQHFTEVDYPIWLGEPVREMPMGIQATSHGFISIQLHSDVRVVITVDQAIRCISNSKGIIVSLNSNGVVSSMLHPCGKLYQYGSRVEVTTTDPHGNPKYAKMWYKGVSFNSEHAALTYLVDTAGTRTTTDCFSDIHDDFTLPIFLKDSMHGPIYVPECIRQIQQTEYWVSNQGIENWTVNGIRISQTVDGLVRVARGPGKYVLRISPQSQSSSLTTPYVHATASVGNGRDCHVFVKRGERRMHYDGNTFIVRNGTHAAGFDEKGHLKVY